MSSADLDPPSPATVYDCATRFTIPSRTNPHETHLVELMDYSGNGRCDCMHFATRLEPLLSRGITPEQALEQGLLKTRHVSSQHPQDVLRCRHIIEAYHQFGPMVVRAMNHAKKTHATQAEDSDRPF